MNIIIIGAGGHARVIADILISQKKYKLTGFIDREKSKSETILGHPILGPFEKIDTIVKEKNIKGAIVGVGDNRIRKKYFNALSEKKLEIINAIHSTANVSETCSMGKGNVICRNATICTGVKIGSNSIINTAAIIDHESIIGDHTHIGPGTNIAGGVNISETVFVGIGTTIIQKICIGKETVIGAGSVVLNNIPENCVAAGSPCLVKKKIDPDKWFGDQQVIDINP